MNTLKTELRELAWLASIVTGLSLLGVGLGAALLALSLLSRPSLAQDRLLTGRDPVALTPAQQAIVDRITKAPETVNLRILKATGTKDGSLPGDRYATLVLPLREGKDITLVRTRSTVLSPGGFTWRGQSETGERAVLMLWNDGHLSGYFGYQGRLFSVNNMGEDIHTIAEIDPGKLPPDHALATQPKVPDSTSGRPAPRPSPPEPNVAPFPETERRKLEAKNITIDLMLLYTTAATKHHIGRPADLLALAIEEANETFRNSGVGNVSLRLVHSQPIDYDETDGLHIDHLYRMVDGAGVFKDIKHLRNEKRADIVGLILHSPTGCGLSTRIGADAEEAFFVVHHACAAITVTIAHEIGHILGVRHDRAIDAGNSPFPYGHGYVNGSKWRDIMSYNESCAGCPRIPYWSNPRISYKGEPTGTAASDSARVILEQAERVSNFR